MRLEKAEPIERVMWSRSPACHEQGGRRRMTFKQEVQPRKNVFGPVSEIGQCAVLDLALVAGLE